jgi:hypothetical protein
MQAIVPNAALAATGWTNTNGGVSSYQIDALAYDTVNNLLYAGTTSQGVWSYNGTTWTRVYGGAGSSPPPSADALAYDSVQCPGQANDTAHDFSSQVACTNGQQIIAERPMYFCYNGAWSGGSDVVGFTL